MLAVSPVVWLTFLLLQVDHTLSFSGHRQWSARACCVPGCVLAPGIRWRRHDVHAKAVDIRQRAGFISCMKPQQRRLGCCPWYISVAPDTSLLALEHVRSSWTSALPLCYFCASPSLLYISVAPAQPLHHCDACAACPLLEMLSQTTHRTSYRRVPDLCIDCLLACRRAWPLRRPVLGHIA